MTALPDPDYQAEFYASVPAKRLIAWIIDSILIFALSAGAVVLTAFTGLLIWPLLYLAVGFAYRTVTIANGSATWGMRFAGIELRDGEGRRMDSGMAALHTAGYTLSLALPVLQVISVILMLTSSRGQGLTDHFLGTVMLNRRV
ncbi:RDD family protein [Leisingera daeponensis]|uniref:RDD family protein n=1 Tax=Leisingera daeponensis TaxID=405746 RepID=A0ABS7N9V7_9RHOB|nr:RDD family protein [Leisingera daeponensis]MBY6137987.1 RDD family protein [Leisingera daeponensis]